MGYLFDVHLHYPEKLNDLHSGYAIIAPGNQAIMKDMLLKTGSKQTMRSSQLKH